MTSYLPYTRGQQMLLPPALQDRLPQGTGPLGGGFVFIGRLAVMQPPYTNKTGLNKHQRDAGDSEHMGSNSKETVQHPVSK